LRTNHHSCCQVQGQMLLTRAKRWLCCPYIQRTTQWTHCIWWNVLWHVEQIEYFLFRELLGTCQSLRHACSVCENGLPSPCSFPVWHSMVFKLIDFQRFNYWFVCVCACMCLFQTSCGK
jgi:hypothetical protein